jgi:predicted nucleic-acid-binding protein
LPSCSTRRDPATPARAGAPATEINWARALPRPFALEVYERERLDFAEAYLVAQAEATGVREVLSFDRSIERVKTVTRREP